MIGWGTIVNMCRCQFNLAENNPCGKCPSGVGACGGICAGVMKLLEARKSVVTKEIISADGLEAVVDVQQSVTEVL